MPGRHLSFIAVTACVLLVSLSPPANAADEFEDPGAVLPDATTYQPAFADVADDHVFAAAIRTIYAGGITKGCDSGAKNYCPDSPVTRGQMAAFLTRALGLPESQAANFTDDNGHIFENAIQRLAAAGITSGCNPPANDHYCPDSPVTRGQMAAFLARALDLKAPPAVPEGVDLERLPSTASGRGARIEVCRAEEMSLMVRSVTGGVIGLAEAWAWDPSSLEISAGELSVESDRWYLPPAQGCESIDVAWDPRTNALSAPLDALDVTSPFGLRRHPILGGLRLHTGTDFDADAGDPVYAAAPGVVVFTGVRGGYGILVEIRHAGGLDTLYAHLSSIAVAVGDTVTPPDMVGRVGCTGLCTGSHLHFESREFRVPVDPMTYLQDAN